MSILDRLQLLVRSQVGSPAPEPGAASSAYTGARPRPVAPRVEARTVESLEQRALQAAASGDMDNARRLAAAAADAEFHLSGGRFGAPDSGAASSPLAATSAAQVQIPQNPYGVANPPMANAPALRPTAGQAAAAAAAPDWYAGDTAEQRFDRYVGGSTPGIADGAPDDALRSLRSIFNPENP